MTAVQTTPAHDAILDVVGDQTMTAPEIVAAVRKPARPELAGYYAPLAVQVHLDQLVAWGLLDLVDGTYVAESMN